MLPSEISISSLNSSNSLNVKTLMKKKYYKDKQLYMEFKWNDVVDTFENEEVLTNHVGWVPCASQVQLMTKVLWPVKMYELDWSLFSMNCR